MRLDQLWELLERWYQIAANESVHPDTRHGYRECANQLDDLLGSFNPEWQVTGPGLFVIPEATVAEVNPK